MVQLRRSSWPTISLVIVLLALIVAGSATAWYGYSAAEDSGPAGQPAAAGTPAEASSDPGVTACRQMADGINPATGEPNKPGGKLSKSEYRKLRDAFDSSEHGDIRKAGTAFADTIWRMSEADESDQWQHIEPLTNAMTKVTAACAAHGVVITS